MCENTTLRPPRHRAIATDRDPRERLRAATPTVVRRGRRAIQRSGFTLRSGARATLVLAQTLLLALPTPALAVTDGSTLAVGRGAPGLTGGSPEVPTGESDTVSASTNPFTGAATLSVPIFVPPGTGGMQPALALRYSSGNRSDTWVGFGWTLGLGSVRRRNRLLPAKGSQRRIAAAVQRRKDHHKADSPERI